MRVFLRIGRRIRITPAGESLLQLSHRVFQDLNDTVATISDSQETLRGTVRDNPLAAIGTALVLGLLIARVTR